MSRNAEFRGQLYRSGGIGHLPGDDSRSVVGMVPISRMLPYRDHTGDQHPHSERIVEGIARELRAGGHIHEPLMLEYDHKNGVGYLGEGNHRLEAARRAGQTHVPVRVYGRARDLPERRKGKVAPLRLKTSWQGGMGEDYVPPDIHPGHFGLT